MNEINTDSVATADSLNGLDSVITNSTNAFETAIVSIVTAIAVFYLIKWIIGIIELKRNRRIWDRGIIAGILRIILIMFVIRVITIAILKLELGEHNLVLLVLFSISLIAIYPMIFNFLSGILLSFNRSIQLGDLIQMKHERGEVLKFTPLSVVIKTDSQNNYFIPNGHFLKESFMNITQKSKPHFVAFHYPIPGKPDFEKLRTFAVETALSAPYIDLKNKTVVYFSQDEQGQPVMVLNAFIEKPENEQAFISYLVENIHSDENTG